jgi:hypothetical protein
MPVSHTTGGLDWIEATSIQVLACLQTALCDWNDRDMDHWY